MSSLPRYAIFGLGNPGPAYAGTRHNLGFMVIEALIARILGSEAVLRLHETGKHKHHSDYWTATAAGHELLLIQPQTFMNRSGIAVQAVLQFYKLPAKQALIIYDDVSLPFGTAKIKERGSSGGHNGMASIIGSIGPEIPRLKCGIAPMELESKKPSSVHYDLKRYVLEAFSSDEEAILTDVAGKLADVALCMISKGISWTTTRCHGKAYTEWPTEWSTK